MKRIIISRHARQQMAERGASEKEVTEAVTKGESVPAKHGRVMYRHNFQYNNKWGNRFYHIKQVAPVVKKETNDIVVVTVYTFYF